MNTLKTKYHNEIVQSSKNGDVIGLLDCDLMVLRSLEEIENEKFDLAITYRPFGCPLIFNSGVVFVHISDSTKDFYSEWFDMCLRMLKDKELFDEWRGKFGGINQTSLGYLLKCSRWKFLKLLKLDCWEWNCENNTWEQFNENQTKIVHITGKLRECALRMEAAPNHQIGRLATLWNRFEDKRM